MVWPSVAIFYGFCYLGPWISFNDFPPSCRFTQLSAVCLILPRKLYLLYFLLTDERTRYAFPPTRRRLYWWNPGRGIYKPGRVLRGGLRGLRRSRVHPWRELHADSERLLRHGDRGVRCLL